jgi:hypothetical protein
MLAGAGVLGLAMLAAAGRVASVEWFSADDFAFLARVQRPDLWSWRGAYLPLADPFWPFYRPLGMETYFKLGFEAFGLDAPAFFAVSLAAHFARGVLVYRIARQLGCALPAALVGGLLGVSGVATLGEIFAGSIFHYVANSLATLACLTCFLSALRGGGAGAQLGSLVALAAALLCDEGAAVLPGLLFAVALYDAGSVLRAAAWRRALRRVAPHAALWAAYLVLRFQLIPASDESALYTQAVDARMLRNAVAQIGLACRGPAGVALLAALGLMGVLASRRTPRGGGDLARAAWLCSAWIAIALLPFVVLPFPQLRHSIAIEAPLALLAALALEAIWRGFGARCPRGLELAFLLLAGVAFPWTSLAEHARNPVGDAPRRLIAFLEAQALPDPAQVVVFYGVEGLADTRAGERFRRLAWNGTVAYAVWPDRRVVLRFHDLNQRVPRAVLRHDAFFVALLPDLALAPADPAWLARELPRALAAGGKP